MCLSKTLGDRKQAAVEISALVEEKLWAATPVDPEPVREADSSDLTVSSRTFYWHCMSARVSWSLTW